MKNITLKESREYKSVKEIGEVEVPIFTVLTGVNGAGKTHLLQAIDEGAIRVFIDDEIIHTDNIAFYNWGDFMVQSPPTADKWKIGQRREQLWTTMRNQLKSGKAAQRIKSHPERVGKSLSMDELLIKPINEMGLKEPIASLVDKERRDIRNELISAVGTKHSELIETIEHLTKKMIVELSEKEFEDAAALVAHRVDPLRLQVSELFLAYRTALDKNILLGLKSESKDSSHLTDEQFRASYGPPPWEVLNDMLADLGLDFEVDQPDIAQESYTVTLEQKTSKTEIQFSDLSSGEKILMALAISLYGSGESRHRIRLPKIMLLDEVDAPLHPDMTRIFFRVIEQLLINQNVGVIIATHNPSTVALAPQGTVMRMSKIVPRLFTVTRQQALTDLTAGINAFTVRIDKRRVVFVEGNSDAETYTALSDALRNHLNAEYGLAFISAGVRAGEGGSSIVQKHVRGLREAGVESIYGLIDRDKGNKPQEDGSVLVLGEEGRYTLENYLFDPLLMAALAIRQKFSHKIEGFDELLGEESGTWRGFNRANQSLLQKTCDLMLKQIPHGSDEVSTDKVVTNLVGGQLIYLPRWFIDKPGHKLWELWFKAIPIFRQFENEDRLRKAVVSFVVPDVPQLLSRDLLDVLTELSG